MAAERRELREALDDTSAVLTLMREAGAPSARLEGNVAKIEAALGALLPELRQEDEEEGVLQANPLAQEGDGKAQVDSAADDEEEALVPLDPDGAVLKLLEQSVPCAPRRDSSPSDGGSEEARELCLGPLVSIR